MKTPEEIFDKCLQARGIDRIGLQDAEVYEAGLDAIKQALTIPVVVRQSEQLCQHKYQDIRYGISRCVICGEEEQSF